MMFSRRKPQSKLWKEERGAETIEFLAMLPFYGLLFLLFLQLIFLGLGFIVSQHAVNEAAKIYAITGDEGRSTDVAKEIVGNRTSLMQFSGLSVQTLENKEFVVTLNVSYTLNFLSFLSPNPDLLRYQIDHKAHGRMLLDAGILPGPSPKDHTDFAAIFLAPALAWMVHHVEGRSTR